MKCDKIPYNLLHKSSSKTHWQKTNFLYESVLRRRKGMQEGMAPKHTSTLESIWLYTLSL